MVTYLRAFFFAAGLAFALMLGLSLRSEPLVGDLARLGNFAERDFGWRADQPAFALHTGIEPGEPDTLVIGDSFSGVNIWQSVTMDATGRRLLSYHWDSLGNPGCLETFIQGMRALHPSLRQVVVETVEREYYIRFFLKPPTSQCPPVGAPMQNGLTQTIAHRPRLPLEYGLPLIGDPIYLLRAAFNTRRYSETPVQSGDTYVTPLTRSDLFSNRTAGNLLYYHGDDFKNGWSPEAVDAGAAFLAQLQERLRAQGLGLWMMVIPDKSLVYRPYMKFPEQSPKDPGVEDALVRHGVSTIRLLTPLREAAVSRAPDVYLPDDTHTGVRGFQVIGEEAARLLGRATPGTP